MATREQMHALLSITCPHCGAGPDSVCRVRIPRHGRIVSLPITSLDGGCHDARWQAALGASAEVRPDIVAERHRRASTVRVASRGTVAVLDPPTPQEAPDERPW